MTQLCLAMADLILLMPEWTNALSELMAKLSGSPATVPALLEVLLLLPEEVDSRHLRLGSNRRSQIKQMLSLSAPHIAQFLHSVLVEEGSGVARQVSVVKCYSSWLTLGCIQLSSVQVNEKCHQIFHRVFPTGFSSNGLSSVCVVTRPLPTARSPRSPGLRGRSAPSWR